MSELYCKVCKKHYGTADTGAEARHKAWKHNRGIRHKERLNKLEERLK